MSVYFLFRRNLLSVRQAKGHETLCNRLHPNSLCTSKLIEFQSKRLNSLITFLLSQQQSSKRVDVQHTSSKPGQPITVDVALQPKHQSNRPPLTRNETAIEVDAYYRYLCRKRHTNPAPRRCWQTSATPTIARLVSGNQTANWQSKQHQIANTNNNRTNTANNERYIQLLSNCYRSDLHSFINCRGDSKVLPQQQRRVGEQSDSLETAALAGLHPIVQRIKSTESTESAVSCEIDVDVGASLPPTIQTVSLDATKSIVDNFGATKRANYPQLNGDNDKVVVAQRKRIGCTCSRHPSKAPQTIEQAIRLTHLIRTTNSISKRPVRLELLGALPTKNNMNFNASNANDDKHSQNFQLSCQAVHCGALSRQEYQQTDHLRTVNDNHCYSIDANCTGNNNYICNTAGNGVNNNIINNNREVRVTTTTTAATAASTTTFGCVDHLIDTFNESLNLMYADNRKPLPQIILSDFSSSATGPVSTSLLFTRPAAAVQTSAEHSIVIDTPTTATHATDSIYLPM